MRNMALPPQFALFLRSCWDHWFTTRWFTTRWFTTCWFTTRCCGQIPYRWSLSRAIQRQSYASVSRVLGALPQGRIPSSVRRERSVGFLHEPNRIELCRFVLNRVHYNLSGAREEARVVKLWPYQPVHAVTPPGLWRLTFAFVRAFGIALPRQSQGTAAGAARPRSSQPDDSIHGRSEVLYCTAFPTSSLSHTLGVLWEAFYAGQVGDDAVLLP